MRFRGLLFFSLLVTTLSVGSVQAQLEQAPAGERRMLELVDQLKELIQRAERSRTSDPSVLQQLRDLVRRYDWPWRARLLSDDFSESNYRLEQTWVVDRGDFRVVRGQGLRTVFIPQASPGRGSTERRGESPALDILGGILKGMTEPGAGSGQPSPPSAAEIRTELRISSAFAVRLQLASRARSDGDRRLEFGPYQGRERNSGYRLAYNPGKRPAFELLRIVPGRSAVIEVSQGSIDLEDGLAHDLEWRRGGDGEMIVLLDGREILRAMDRAFGDGFNGFTIVNGGGDYTLSRVEIFGTSR